MGGFKEGGGQGGAAELLKEATGPGIPENSEGPVQSSNLNSSSKLQPVRHSSSLGDTTSRTSG